MFLCCHGPLLYFPNLLRSNDLQRDYLKVRILCPVLIREVISKPFRRITFVLALAVIKRYAASISLLAAMSTSTLSLALSIRRAFLFWSMWSIIRCAIS